jgi:hypothetical protein
MSTKAKSKAKPAKSAAKAAPKAAMLKAGKKSAAPAGKQAKGSEAPVEGAPVVDLEELEEQEAEAASARAGSGSPEAELAAAAAGTGEMSASFKNFRHHPDMENFYRFIFENDLRHEAVAILDKMQSERLLRKNVKAAKSQAH